MQLEERQVRLLAQRDGRAEQLLGLVVASLGARMIASAVSAKIWQLVSSGTACARLEREPLRLVDLAEIGQRRRERCLVVGHEPAVPARRGDAERLAEQLLRALEVTPRPREPAELEQRSREHRLHAELLGGLATSSIIGLGRVELALHLQEAGVRQRRADASAHAAALARELERRVSRISASSSSSRTMCADASACAAIVCRSFRPASSAITYARSM